MNNEFRQGERDIIISAPCVQCGKESDCYATDDKGCDVCKACCDREDYAAFYGNNSEKQGF